MHLKNGGSAGAGLHIGNLLKPALARGVPQLWLGVKDPSCWSSKLLFVQSNIKIVICIALIQTTEVTSLSKESSQFVT
jgi:hypothetical protein